MPCGKKKHGSGNLGVKKWKAHSVISYFSSPDTVYDRGSCWNKNV